MQDSGGYGKTTQINSGARWCMRLDATGLHPVAHQGWLASDQGAWLLQSGVGDRTSVSLTPMAISAIGTALWATMNSTVAAHGARSWSQPCSVKSHN